MGLLLTRLWDQSIRHVIVGTAAVRLGPIAIEAEHLEAGGPVVLFEPVAEAVATDVRTFLRLVPSLPHTDLATMICTVVVYVVDGEEDEFGLSTTGTEGSLGAVVLEDFETD